MTKTNSRENYEKRLSRVTEYIYDHLDEDIDLEKLAAIACLSPYHWYRVYHAMNGETLAATVRRLRLHRAAGYLAHTSLPIAQVAAKSGYANLPSFTRAFSAAYGMPPAQYRQNGSHTEFRAHPRPASDGTREGRDKDRRAHDADHRPARRVVHADR